MAEVARAVEVLLKSALLFKDPVSRKDLRPKNIRASIKCLYTALSLVLPPSKEAEIRVVLGEILLQFSDDLPIAVEHLQKAYRIIQTTSIDVTLRKRVESSLTIGLLKSKMASAALPIIEDGLKRCEDLSDWDGWIHYFILLYKTVGSGAFAKFTGTIEARFDSYQCEFFALLRALAKCSEMKSDLTIQYFRDIDEMQVDKRLVLIKRLVCTALRLKLGYAEGVKAARIEAQKVLKTEITCVLPGKFKIDELICKRLLEYLLLLGQIKFTLSEFDAPHYVNTLEPMNDIVLEHVAAELAALQARNFKGLGKEFSDLEKILIGTCAPDGYVKDDKFLRGIDWSAFDFNLQLIQVQLLLKTDPIGADEALQSVKNTLGFTPTALSHLLEALVGLAKRDPVHKVKESLLLSLKLLNNPASKDDVLKLAVMLLLASIYRETDFALAEKMSATAYSFSCNLGNHKFALLAGSILARMLELRGDEAKAAEQRDRNAGHKQHCLSITYMQ